MTLVRTPAPHRDAPRRASPARRWRPGALPVQLAVFVVAVGSRLTVILRHGGLHGDYGYDAGVYFAAGDAFVHGRLPYRDFVLIHPPVVMLVLSPFAELTRIMGDESAFTVTVLACTVLGGVNAVLVVRVLQRLGVGLRAATAGGLFYALWYGAIGSEYLVKLEPIGNLFLLLGLLALLRARPGGPLRWPVLAGVALGATVSVKIWWIVPFAVALLWLAWRTRSGRQVSAALAGAVAVSVAVDGPFFLASPRAMWTSVVDDQVTRRSIAGSPLTRLTDLSSLPRLTGPLPRPWMVVVSVVLALAVAWLARRAWRQVAARPAVVLLGVQGMVLLAAPSWFPFYADFLAVAASLVVGAAAVRRPVDGRAPIAVPAAWLFVAAAAGITVPALAVGRDAVRPFPGAAALAAATRSQQCVLSDSPMGQIELDALTRGLTHGCRNWVDVTGRTYGPDRSAQPRPRNLRWQRDLTAYLRSGDAVIIVRRGGTGVSPATQRAISRDGVLARAGGRTVYRVGPARPAR